MKAFERLGGLDEGTQMIGLVSSGPVAESEARFKSDEDIETMSV